MKANVSGRTISRLRGSGFRRCLQPIRLVDPNAIRGAIRADSGDVDSDAATGSLYGHRRDGYIPVCRARRLVVERGHGLRGVTLPFQLAALQVLGERHAVRFKAEGRVPGLPA